MEVWLAWHYPGVETYLDTEKKHSFELSFFPATQFSSVYNTIGHKNKMSRATALLPAALPCISIDSSSMAPNHGTVAPHESTAGAWWPGLCSLELVPLFGAPKWHQLINREMGRALPLGGRHSMGRHNNQPKVGGSKGGEVGETVRWAIMKGWDTIPLFGGSN